MSKELKALKDIKECLYWSEEGIKKIEIIETALKDSEWYKNKMIKFEKAFTEENEEKLKLKEVLEIIKEKCNISFSDYELDNEEKRYITIQRKSDELTTRNTIFLKIENQEEFDLLKEVLK